MMRAISSADFVSKPWDAELTLSVIRSCSSRSVGEWISPSSSVLVIRVAGVKVAIFVSDTSVYVFYRSCQNVDAGKCRTGLPELRPAYPQITSRSDFLIGGKLAPENIVETRAQIANCLIGAVRPGSVCQESDRDSSIQVDPKRRAGESEMAD